MKFNLGDYTETPAVIAYAGLAIITALVDKHLLTGSEFVTSFVAIIGCFTAHSLCDDKFPDRNTTEVKVDVHN